MIVLDTVRPMPVVERPIREATGFVLSEDVLASIDLPAFRNSAMDGYALRSFDTAGASPNQPSRFTVVGSTAAGDEAWSDSLEAMTAVRVMTGAALPVEADAVVRLEDIEGRDDRILISTEIQRGAHVREVGSDLARGGKAVAAGSTLSWASAGLLISIGVPAVSVHAQPVVAVISTGDELSDDRPVGSLESIPDSNGPMLMELIRQAGAHPVFAGIARDSPVALARALAEGASADAIVISGGVSAGDRDAVRDLVTARDAVVFSQVRMKPGRPFTFALLDGNPVFALPGNPFAAAATFLQFVRPALDRMSGRTIDRDDARYAEMASSIENPGNRRLIVPVRLQSRVAALPIAERISEDVAGLALMARANGLLIVPESTKTVHAGGVCEFWPLPR